MTNVQYVKHKIFNYFDNLSDEASWSVSGNEDYLKAWTCRCELRELSEKEEWPDSHKLELEQWISDGKLFDEKTKGLEKYGDAFNSMFNQLMEINNRLVLAEKLLGNQKLEKFNQIIGNDITKILFEDFSYSIVLRLCRLLTDSRLFPQTATLGSISCRNGFIVWLLNRTSWGRKKTKKQRECFTFEKFIEDIAGNDQSFLEEFSIKIQKIKKLKILKKLKRIRDKSIAHLDYQWIKGSSVAKCKPIEIIECVDLLNNLFNEVSNEKIQSEYMSLVPDHIKSHLDDLERTIKRSFKYECYEDVIGDFTNKHNEKSKILEDHILSYPGFDDFIKNSSKPWIHKTQHEYLFLKSFVK